MPAKNQKKVAENKPAPAEVVAPAVPAPVAPAPVVAAPAETKRGKKTAPVVAPVPAAAPAAAPEAAVVAEVAPAAPATAETKPKRKPAKKTGKTVTKGKKRVAKSKKTVKAKKPAKKPAVKAPKKKVPKKAAAPEIKLSDEDRKRYFKLLYGDETVPNGRFSGKKPKQAANKAYTSIVKSLEEQGKPFIGVDIKFTLKECTRWNKKKCKKDSNGDKVDKLYFYIGRRELLKQEVVVDHVQKENVPEGILKVGRVVEEKTLENGEVKSYIEAKVSELKPFVTTKKKGDNDLMRVIVKKTTAGTLNVINEIVYKHTNNVSKFKAEETK